MTAEEESEGERGWRGEGAGLLFVIALLVAAVRESRFWKEDVALVGVGVRAR